ncbi:MAG: DMT family transporter [Clostridiales bacterium]|nr:DMT family transporter [Clostridiales bacterium]
MKLKENKTTACLLIMLQCAIYGLGDPLAKYAYQHIGVYSMLSVRYAIALGFMLLLFGKRVWENLRRCSVKTWIAPCLCVAGAYLFNNMALTCTAATVAAFLRSTSVIMTPLLLWLIYGKQITLRYWLIVIVAVTGLYLLCGQNGMFSFGVGELLGIATAMCSAGALISSHEALKHIDSITLTTMETAASTVFALVCALTFDGGVCVGRQDTVVWGIILYLAIISTLGGYMLQNLALKKTSARVISTLKCISPVMTAFFSYLILGEQMKPSGVVGSAIILLCVIAQTGMKEQ